MPIQHAKRAVARYLHRRHPKLWLASRIARHDRHFEPEFWLIPSFCDRQRIAVDVGANAGEFSFFMARYARDVVAFEPNPDLWPNLKRLVGHRLRIEGVALSAAPGSATFRYVEDNTGVATIEASNKLGMIEDAGTIRTRTVPVRTLDSYDLQDVSFIKIDVEGHEEAVIAGAIETLRRCRPALLIESENRHNPGAPRRLADRLRELGYHGFYLRDGKRRDMAAVSESECDPANLSRGLPYVSNYVFTLPEHQLPK
jgi:FkbM family methyltransferase